MNLLEIVIDLFLEVTLMYLIFSLLTFDVKMLLLPSAECPSSDKVMVHKPFPYVPCIRTSQPSYLIQIQNISRG